MDDLLVLAAELAENNNFKKADYQEETKPDGRYEVSIEAIKLKESSNTGTRWFSFVLPVLDGEFVGEKFYVSLYLSEKTTKGTLSKIMNLLNVLGYEIDLTMFNDAEVLEKGLQTLIGEKVTLNKKTSGKGFINYSFEGGE